MYNDTNIEKPNYQAIFCLFLLILVNHCYYYKGISANHLSTYLITITPCCWLVTGWSWIPSLFAKKNIIFLLTSISFTISSYYSVVSGFGFTIYFFMGLMILVSFSSTERYQSYIIKFYAYFSAIYVIITFISAAFPSIFLNNLSLFYQEPQLSKVIALTGIQNYAGLAGHSDKNGFFISILIGILIAQLFYRKKNKTITLVLFLIVFIALLYTKRRGAFVSTVVASIVLLFFFMQKSRSLLESIIVLLLLCISFYIIATYIPQFDELFTKNEELIKGDDITNGRLDLYEFAWKLYMEKPFFGQGPLTYIKLRQNYMVNLDDHNVHSTYIQLMAETGIIGTLLFISCLLLILYKTIRVLRNSTENSRLISISLYVQIVFIVLAFSESIGFEFQVLYTYFLFASIPLYYYQYIHEEQEAVEQ